MTASFNDLQTIAGTNNPCVVLENISVREREREREPNYLTEARLDKKSPLQHYKIQSLIF
jgi:hypothetical protein